MTIILYANRNTGICVLSYLIAKGYLVKLITDDDADIITVANYYGVEVITFEEMGDYDLFICCHGRKIIADKYLSDKMINIHPCLFKYKGHNPVERYIKNKDTVGSVESLYLTAEVDAGEVICREEFETPVIETYAEFYNIALPYYFKLIHETLLKLKINNIEGWMSEDELEFLYDTAKKMKDVVEIGSYKGKSTVALLGSGAKVIAIDTWEGNDDLKVTNRDYYEFLKNTGGSDNLTTIVGDSVERSKDIDDVDMVFLDGDHSYEGVKRDIEAWLPKTKKLICGHDYDLPEVKQAVDEAFKIDELIGSIWIKRI